MKSGRCPKCGQTAVYRSRGKTVLNTGVRADDGVLLLNLHRQKRIFDDFKLLHLESYLCRACGYLELYVEDLKELATWKRPMTGNLFPRIKSPRLSNQLW